MFEVLDKSLDDMMKSEGCLDANTLKIAENLISAREQEQVCFACECKLWVRALNDPQFAIEFAFWSAWTPSKALEELKLLH